MIGPNWNRAYSFRDCLWMFSFLDEPGSRRRRPIKTNSPAEAQDTYHHHSILLVKGGIDQIIDERLFGSVVDSRRWGLEPEVNLPKETIALTSMRSCHIQRLYKKEKFSKRSVSMPPRGTSSFKSNSLMMNVSSCFRCKIFDV